MLVRRNLRKALASADRKARKTRFVLDVAITVHTHRKKQLALSRDACQRLVHVRIVALEFDHLRMPDSFCSMRNFILSLMMGIDDETQG